MPALRDTLSELADRIEELYVFPEAARRIAEELRDRPIRTSDPAELAAEVKQFLRGHDGHLNLIWLPGVGTGIGTTPEKGPSRPDVMDPDYQRRTNYGFRRSGLIEDGVGLLELSLVTDADLAPVLAAAKAATTMLAHAETVIIDLRGVPGGWQSGVNLLSGHFLGAEPTHLLTMSSRGDEPDHEDWTPADNALGIRPDIPLFILVDGESASAAEAFAYTAQSMKRAVIVGQRTVGAANPGDFVPIGTEFKAFIPTMAPIDPRTGGNWEGTGVRPDVVTEPGQAVDTALALIRDL